MDAMLLRMLFWFVLAAFVTSFVVAPALLFYIARQRRRFYERRGREWNVVGEDIRMGVDRPRGRFTL